MSQTHGIIKRSSFLCQNFIKKTHRTIQFQLKQTDMEAPTYMSIGDLKCPQLNNQITDAPFGSSNSGDKLIGKFQLPIYLHDREKKQYQRTKNPKYGRNEHFSHVLGTAAQQFVEQVMCAGTDL